MGASGTRSLGSSLVSDNTISVGPFDAATWTISPANPYTRPEPINCGARRGGPDSKIFCEVPNLVPHTTHAGRGSTKWYTWEDDPEA